MNLGCCLKDFQNILVTGPQRSGTRFASNVIASDLGHSFVDEMEIGIDDLERFFCLMKNNEKKVVHCPGLSYICHQIKSKSTCVVFMMRKIDDIIESQKRINWESEYEQREYVKYLSFDKEPIAKLKYETWEKIQKPTMNCPYFEVQYDALREHKLWVRFSNRKGFEWDQVKDRTVKMI